MAVADRPFDVRHAGLVARRLGGVWRGALIEGPSGYGKSDLAIRCLEAGFRLVADDRTVVFLSAGRLYGRAPAVLEGLIEHRGLGLVRHPAIAFAEIALIVRCEAAPEAVERLPDPAFETLLGTPAPLLRLWPFEGSAPAKLSRALEVLGRGAQEAYQASLAPLGRRLGA
ncbi:HPr kinase/phosphorylase [Caulobacter sp. KR2-114]|uniref:HPr kinase/phosphorylase n=1 Tax=Caulobacter sp. KR2-114 TaxID=3400912 RepID=UPI003C0A4CAA